MFTPRAKILGATVAAVVVVGGLSYAQLQTQEQVAKLTADQTPVVITKTIVVTPTVEPTATPAGVLKFTPVKSVTKGVSK